MCTDRCSGRHEMSVQGGCQPTLLVYNYQTNTMVGRPPGQRPPPPVYRQMLLKHYLPLQLLITTSCPYNVCSVLKQITTNVVISAVGGLHVPNISKFEGQDQFKGGAFHSAQWKKGYDPTGRTVAVIGTGASAVQVIPSIADKARIS